MPLRCSEPHSAPASAPLWLTMAIGRVPQVVEVERRGAVGQQRLRAHRPEPWQFGPITVTPCVRAAVGQLHRDLLAFARLLEAGAEHDRVADALGAALVDEARHRLRRRDDQRHVGRLGQVGERLVGLQALDLGSSVSPDRRALEAVLAAPRAPASCAACRASGKRRRWPRCGDGTGDRGQQISFASRQHPQHARGIFQSFEPLHRAMHRSICSFDRFTGANDAQSTNLRTTSSQVMGDSALPGTPRPTRSKRRPSCRTISTRPGGSSRFQSKLESSTGTTLQAIASTSGSRSASGVKSASCMAPRAAATATR